MLFNNSKKKDWYFFIKRTRIAIVLSLIILILGYLSVKRLPQEVYPDISSPVVYVDASYTGASASVMETSVASVIEAGLTGLDNVQYMESNCSDGSYSLSIYFKSGSNKDVNLLNVKNQLQEINFQLPSEVSLLLSLSSSSRFCIILEKTSSTCRSNSSCLLEFFFVILI